MLRALRLARRGQGRVEPNPMVGCVIVHGAKVLGEGYHRCFGGPHAEIEALASCRGRAQGATVYVTLEPCSCFGKTPPCVDALIQAKVAEVVAPVRDPNPAVCGSGFRRLRAAGIRVRTGVEVDQAARLLAPFATRMVLNRPYVIAKWAQGPDGGLTRPTGESPWISSAPARRWVHQLRARVDAIIVGSGTVLRDDPQLTARDVPIRRRAVRVVVDSRLRTPLGSRLVTTAAETPVVIFTSPAMAQSPKARRLRDRHVEVLASPKGHGGMNLKRCLHTLVKGGATNVLVEGGPALLRSFFATGLVDEAAMFLAPLAFSTGKSRGLLDVLSGLEPFEVTTTALGPDALVRVLLRAPVLIHRPWAAPAGRSRRPGH